MIFSEAVRIVCSVLNELLGEKNSFVPWISLSPKWWGNGLPKQCSDTTKSQQKVGVVQVTALQAEKLKSLAYIESNTLKL